MIFSRKNLGRAVRVLLPLVILMVMFSRASAAATYVVENGLIKLNNGAYEIAFSEDNGGIAYIADLSTNANISEGGGLWYATLDKGDGISSDSYSGQFTYAWEEAQNILTLTYTGAVDVTVTAALSDAPTLTLQASLTNHSGANISGFDLPGQQKVKEAAVADSLLPMMPGALISPEFFTDGRTFINEYPGVMFADYVALRSTQGKLAVYSQKGAVLQPTLIGYEHLKIDGGYTGMTHAYRTWIADGAAWTAPGVILSVGEDYPASIEGYRVAQGIEAYPSLTEKLGDAAPTYFAAPMYKLDLAVLKLKFADLQDAVVNKMNFPGMVHPVAYTTGGHDHNYPDFIPPDKKWGTTDDFAALVGLIHSRGGLVVPYTNFSWWNINSPTLSKLPADVKLGDMANVKEPHGIPNFESYGPNSGIVMNQHNDFVQNKIAEQHDALKNTVGVDGIFEDQWGARSAPYDFNTPGLDTFDPSTSYFEGVLGHYTRRASDNLMTEVGVDALAEKGIAFMGTNYLWDMLGYRGATADVTSYYPMAGMLLRDKVLLYQHDLAAETWTQNKDMLRWNLAQGYSLSNAFLDQSTRGLNMNNPWLNLVGVFQKYALANYADELVTSFDDLGDNVSKTAFSTYTVYANWDADKSYTVGAHTLPPGGVISQADDGSVTAGVFTAYNGSPLSDGDHYLVEVHVKDGLQIFQPVGDDTELHIHNSASWTGVKVTALAYDGTVLGTVDAVVNADDISFTYASLLDGQPVGYYQINPAG